MAKTMTISVEAVKKFIEAVLQADIDLIDELDKEEVKDLVER